MAKLVVPIVVALLVSFQNYSQSKNDNDEDSLFEINTEPISGLTQWKNMKFGMFIHWGVYSIPAGIWKGKQIEKLGEQIMRHADISIEDYENIARQFNPIKFNAGEIVKLAKSTGMKYIVFTAKHHDGFSMFDSKFTDYDIVDFTPYKKDILDELANACRKHDIKLGLYYSTPDWHFNGDEQERNPIDGKISVFGKVSKANEDYQVAQLKELLTNYGEIVELFFDMGEPTKEQSERFAKTVKTLQPNCQVNGRVMNNQGDFITMPDNHLPESPIYDYAWETPGTFYHTWGYKSWVKGDSLDVQIKKQIRKLSKIVCMGGNYLLNIGPMSDGTVVPYERDVLNGVGEWVSQHNEAFYNTKANPFRKLNWGYSTVKAEENKLYLHIFNWPENGNLKIPGLKSEILNAYYLNDILEKPLEVSRMGNNQNIKVASEPVNKNLSIIVVEYKGELEIINPVVKPVNGELLLTNSDATKHGKYGMVSYRSIIKDNHRTWDIELEETGKYEIEITYKHKYAEKDFIIEVDNQQLQFTLIGSSKLHPKKPQSIDGNEELKGEKDNKIKGKWNTIVLGAIHLVKGPQVVTLKSGREYIFAPTMKEFLSKDRRYRGLNVEVKSIRLVKRK